MIFLLLDERVLHSLLKAIELWNRVVQFSKDNLSHLISLILDADFHQLMELPSELQISFLQTLLEGQPNTENVHTMLVKISSIISHHQNESERQVELQKVLKLYAHCYKKHFYTALPPVVFDLLLKLHSEEQQLKMITALASTHLAASELPGIFGLDPNTHTHSPNSNVNSENSEIFVNGLIDSIELHDWLYSLPACQQLFDANDKAIVLKFFTEVLSPWGSLNDPRRVKANFLRAIEEVRHIHSDNHIFKALYRNTIIDNLNECRQRLIAVKNNTVHLEDPLEIISDVLGHLKHRILLINQALGLQFGQTESDMEQRCTLFEAVIKLPISVRNFVKFYFNFGNY